MRTSLTFGVVILSGQFALGAPVSESSANNSTNTTVSAPGSDRGGGGAGGSSAGGSRPSGISSAPAARSAGSVPHTGAYRPAPRPGPARTNPAASRVVRQRPGAVQIPQSRARANRLAVPNRPQVSRPNQEGNRTQTNRGTAAHQPNRAATANQPRISRPTALLRQSKTTEKSVLTTRDGREHEGNWSRRTPANQKRFDRQTQDHLRNWQGKRPNFAEACRNHNDHHRHHHDPLWWHRHCDAVVLIDWGYWGWIEGWWYPAWGYDSYYSYYEYDRPIYGYDGLLPDEIVANVQSVLQELGYYSYEVDGILGPETQDALAVYQADYGLPVTGAIDEATLAALGLN